MSADFVVFPLRFDVRFLCDWNLQQFPSAYWHRWYAAAHHVINM